MSVSHLFEHDSARCGFLGVDEDGTVFRLSSRWQYMLHDVQETEEITIGELRLPILLPDIKMTTRGDSCFSFGEVGCIAADVQNHIRCMVSYFDIRMRDTVVQ
jgi:hypothetical protein